MKQKNAHKIINAKNRANDIVLDVSDAIREKKSRAEINKIVAEWLE